MATRLAIALQEDYQIEGRNGTKAFYTKRAGERLALNKLADEMTAYADFYGVIDGGIQLARLSLVVAGKDGALFTGSQAKVYCVVMQYSTPERQRIMNILAHDLELRQGLDIDPAGDLAELILRKELVDVRRQRSRGNILIAEASACRALETAGDIRREVVLFGTRDLQLRRYEGLLDFEYQIIRRIVLWPGPAIRHGGIALYEALLAVGLDEYANITRGDMCHVLGQVKSSIRWNTLALETWTSENLDPPVQARRALLIDKSRIRDYDGYETEKRKALEWIQKDQLSSDQRFALHEGLAQGEAELGNSKAAFAFLRQARSDLKQARGEKQPIRGYQLIRTTLKLNRKFATIDDQLRAEAQIKAVEAEQQGCLRFSIEIKRLIDR